MTLSREKKSASDFLTESPSPTAPPADLLAEWYAKLPPGSDIETPDGRLRSDFAQRNGSRLVEVSGGTPVSSEHDKLGAAVYRYPLAQRRPDRGRPGVPVHKQRKILRLLARGVPRRTIASKVHVSNRAIDQLRANVRRWKDPDDE